MRQIKMKPEFKRKVTMKCDATAVERNFRIKMRKGDDEGLNIEKNKKKCYEMTFRSAEAIMISNSNKANL